MSERERLIELLQEWGNKENNGVRAESIADYLLDNDIIICGQIYEYEVASYTLDGDGFSFIHLAYMMGNTMHGETHTIEGFKRQYYLTKEQAEKALKGGAE